MLRDRDFLVSDSGNGRRYSWTLVRVLMTEKGSIVETELYVNACLCIFQNGLVLLLGTNHLIGTCQMFCPTPGLYIGDEDN